MSSVVAFTCVAAGGALGASARYALGLLLVSQPGRLPLGILAANVAGCFLAGLIAGLIMTRNDGVSAGVQLFLITGILGGFTTFSSFSLDTLKLASAGHLALACANVALNVTGTLLAVGLGWLLGRSIG